MTIHEIVRQMQDYDRLGHTKRSEYVDFNYRDDLNRIDAYLNSCHISGKTDYLGRKKPFFDIITGTVNVYYRATDFDRKNIKIIPEKDEDVILAFVEDILLKQWMREEKFGQFLNEWGLKLCEYLEAVVKVVEKNGKLILKVVDWNHFMCDVLNFKDNPKIEVFYMTPSQLRKQKGYNKKVVDELIEKKSTRKTMEGQESDTKDNYIELFEVHGEFSVATLKQSQGKKPLEGDEDKYVQQMHVVSFLQDSEDYEDYTLISGEEDDPYFLTSLKPNAEGSITLKGAVKQLFEAQWRVNDNEKQIKDQLELASKVLFQTADGAYIGKNAMNDIDNGDVLVHSPNMPLTQLNNRPDIVAMQSNKSEWMNQAMGAAGINEAMVTAPKAGSAWRQTEAALVEAHSLFELYTENKGLALEEIISKKVLPFLRKKLNHSKAISELLDENQIKFIDKRYISYKVTKLMNQKKKDAILQGNIYDVTQEGTQVADTESLLKQSLESMGQQRFIKPSDIKDKTWKELLDGSNNKLIVEVTGEQKDIQASMTTLKTALQFLMGLQGREMTGEEKLIFGRLLSLSGDLSPLELGQARTEPTAPQMPQMAQQAQPVLQ